MYLIVSRPTAGAPGGCVFTANEVKEERTKLEDDAVNQKWQVGIHLAGACRSLVEYHFELLLLIVLYAHIGRGVAGYSLIPSSRPLPPGW